MLEILSFHWLKLIQVHVLRWVNDAAHPFRICFFRTQKFLQARMHFISCNIISTETRGLCCRQFFPWKLHHHSFRLRKQEPGLLQEWVMTPNSYQELASPAAVTSISPNSQFCHSTDLILALFFGWSVAAEMDGHLLSSTKQYLRFFTRK